MKISVIVPTAKQLAGAGVRIRYRRIVEPLLERGWTLEILPLDDLVFKDLSTVDFVLFSKCQDARSIVLARKGSAAGACVGVDLFDDYFSQLDDARFVMQRQWLGDLSEIAHFALCSTPRMLTVAQSYFGQGRCHLLSDPCDHLDEERLAQNVEAKTSKARRERKVTLAWFGIASNPSFPVGLEDLAAFGGILRRFALRGYNAQLTIMTNIEAVDASRLEMLQRLPVPFTLKTWSEVGEKRLLERSLVAFLPVSYQPFSIAKSLNRGISALVGGSQLLTAGYPLYAELDRYAYGNVDELLGDLEEGSLKLSAATIPDFATSLADISSPDGEAASLTVFLSSLPRREVSNHIPRQRCAVLFGSKGNSAIAQFVKDHGGLAFASPLVEHGKLKFDAHLGFFDGSDDLSLRVSEAALEHMADEFRERATTGGNEETPVWEVPLDPSETSRFVNTRNLLAANGFAQAAQSAQTMASTHQLLGEVFPDHALIDCELDPLFAAATAQGCTGEEPQLETALSGSRDVA